LPNYAFDANYFVRIGAIFFGYVKIASPSEEDATIREKARILDIDRANSARFSCRQRDLPQGIWNTAKCSRFRKQSRAFRRQPQEPWSDNSRGNDGDGTASYRDLRNPEASVRPFVEVNSQPVGYYFAGVWLRLPVVGQLGYGFHDWNAGRAIQPEGERSNDCGYDCPGGYPYPSSG
jgi:hypothetical protein